MKYIDTKLITSKVLRKLAHTIRQPLRLSDPTAKKHNKFTLVHHAASIFDYIAHRRSFAITETGRFAWVPDSTEEDDQVACILAMTYP